jgi:hypothetical protein
VLDEQLEEVLVVAELSEYLACVEGHVDVVLVLVAQLVNQVVEHILGLLLENLLDQGLLGRELWLGGGLIGFEVGALASVPLLLLGLGLDLDLDEVDQEEGKGVVLKVLQKGVEDLAVLLYQEVLEERLLLLDQQLFHNFEKVSAKDGFRILIGVEEGSELVKKPVVGSLNGIGGLLLLSFVVFGVELGRRLVGLLGLLALFAVFNVLFGGVLLHKVVLVVGGGRNLGRVLLGILVLVEGGLEADLGGFLFALLGLVTILKVSVDLLNELLGLRTVIILTRQKHTIRAI